MFTALLEQLPLIPDGNYHEIRYEDLEQDPVQTVKSIYESLSLPNFEIVAEDLRSYVDSIAHYRKNDHSQLPAEWKRRIDDAWERFFHHWGYDFE